MKGVQPLLRAMRDSDADAVIDLIWALNRHEAAAGAPRRQDRVAAMRCLDQDQESAHQSQGELVVAELHGGLVGFMALSQREGGPYLPDALVPHLYIEDLVVDAAHRGAGIGTAMLAYAEDFARRHGLRHIALGVVSGNRRAQDLYAREGFAPIAIEMAKIIEP